jgi:hypothetical protein
MNFPLPGVSWPSGALTRAVRVLAKCGPYPSAGGFAHGQMTLQRTPGAMGAQPDAIVDVLA